MRILVLGGGTSLEREVSLRSAAAVQEGLNDLGHNVIFLDPAEGDEAVIRAARNVDLVFPILHGTGGEDGTIQRVLDIAKKPYLGSNVEVSALCFDKSKLKELLDLNDIRTPRGTVVTIETFQDSQLIEAPFILKPIAEGSSVGTMIVREPPLDNKLLPTLFRKYPKMLLEELIIGHEVTVAVLGSDALPVIEIVPPAGGEFDFENKYNGATAELCPPKNIGNEMQFRISRLAEKVHALSGARHLSRTDIMIDESGLIYVLELNTMPGMTEQSLFPKAAAAAGLPWTKLVERFVALAGS